MLVGVLAPGVTVLAGPVVLGIAGRVPGGGVVVMAGASLLLLAVTAISFGSSDSPQATPHDASQTAGRTTRLIVLLIVCTSTV